jgi:glycosyltransferase involved in cell wall biosynthesis
VIAAAERPPTRAPRRGALLVGIDATCWGNGRGYGRHARSLLGALLARGGDQRYTLYVDSEATARALPPGADARLVPSARPTVDAASADGHRSVRDAWRMSRALADPALDVLFFPTVYSFVPVVGRARKVVMLHDAIVERFPELTLPDPRARMLWRAKVALGLRQADAVATVSAYSRRQLARHFGLAEARIAVVGEAGDPAFRRLDDAAPTPRLRELGLADGRLVVYVGGFGPHKNLGTLLDAVAALPEGLADTRLVLVGAEQDAFHSELAALRARAEALGIASRIVWTGFLPDPDLVVLLNRASLLALPSLMEGFGLPAVEAAACGCPVVATTESPLPELLGEAGRYVDPNDRAGWTRALVEVLASPERRTEMGRAGQSAAAALSWEAAADELAALFEAVAR